MLVYMIIKLLYIHYNQKIIVHNQQTIIDGQTKLGELIKK